MPSVSEVRNMDHAEGKASNGPGDHFNLNSLSQILGLATIYFVVSKLGLLLAIPPGYATAVWPASGIALGCLLIYGVHLWPGILLGSAALNLYTSFGISAPTGFAISSLVLPISIGIGAALQALLGAALIHRYIGFPNPLDDDRDVIKLLLFGGPLACLLNASWGSASLFVSGIVSIETIPFTWWTWWVGDSIGVLIFLPLTLIVLAAPRKDWLPKFLTVGIPLVITFAVAVAVFYLMEADSWAVLAGALLFTGLLGAFLLVISGRTAMIERLVKLRTEELNISEARFRNIFENSASGMVSVDVEGRILQVNPALCEFLGYASEELLAMRIAEITHPDDLGKTRSERANLLFGEASSTFLRKRYLRKNGDTVWGDASISLVRDADGTAKYLVGQINDITERKRAEEMLVRSEARYHSIVEDQTEYIIRMLPDGTRTFTNQAYCRFLGKTADELMGASLYEVVPNDQRDDLKAHFAGLTPQNDRVEYQNQALRHDGEYRSVHWIDRAIFDDQGRVIELQAVGRDITERKRVDDALNGALMDAEKANKAKSEFLANMSHELRTPLNAISGFSEMLTGEFFGTLGSPKYKEYADDIRVSSEYLLNLVNDILDLSAVEAGKQSLAKERLIVDDVIKGCSTVIAAAAENKSIDYAVDLPDEIQPLLADRRALKQILLNVLSNATKFTPAGGRVTLKITESNNHHVFEVSDTGEGVPADKLSSLTDPFVRANTNPHMAQEGTGLGLAIVKSLVNLHNGELNIKSKVGEGTIVTVMLPSDTP